MNYRRIIILFVSVFCTTELWAAEKTLAEYWQQNTGETCFFAIWIIGMLVMLIHMPLEIFVFKPVKKFNKETFVKMRKRKGLPEFLSEEESEECLQLSEDAFVGWSIYEFKSIFGVKNIALPDNKVSYNNAAKKMKEAYNIMPSDRRICEELNRKRDILITASKREFFGSMIFLVGGILMFILGIFASISNGDPYMAIYTGLGVILYAAASSCKLYEKQLYLRKGQRSGSAIINGILRFIYESSKSRNSHSTYFAWIIGGVLVIACISCLSFVAIFSYIKNYILDR